MHPILADGGELTIMRDLAAFTYGTWDVEWPDSVPEENRPVIRDDRQHGYVYRMPKQVGRMGRRFVRADVTITAAEYTPQATPIAHSGASDVEHTLDEATKRTEGNVFLERAVTRTGLGMLVPYKDFDVDDVLPVDVWGKIIERPVTSIDVITERGAVIDWRVHFGDALVGDEASRGRANAEIFRTIAQERRERIREVGEVRGEAKDAQAAASSAQSTADTAVSDVSSLREVLSGPGASDKDVRAQLRELNRQIQAHGESNEFLPLLPAYIAANTQRWKAQEEIDRMQDEQAKLALALAEANRLAIAVQEEAEWRRPRPVFAKFSAYKGGYTDPEGFVTIRPHYVGDRGFWIRCLGEWTGKIVVRATAIGPLSANSIDSVGADVTAAQRDFTGQPEAAHLSYNTLDLTIYPD